MIEIIKQEQLAIELLRKTARHWPDSLWLFSANGTLYVMRKHDGARIYEADYIVDMIDIDNDGGDW